MKREVMVQKGISANKLKKKKQGSHVNLIGRLCTCSLNCDLAEVAKLLQVELASSDNAFDNLATKDCSACYKGQLKKFGHIIKKVAKNCAAMSVLMQINPENSPRNCQSWDKYFTNHLAATVIVLAAQEAKNKFGMDLIHQMGGCELNPRFNLCLNGNYTSSRQQDAPDVNETKYCAIQSSGAASEDDCDGLEDSANVHNDKVPFRSISFIRRQLPDSALGWPLLRRNNPSSQEALRKLEETNRALVEWNSNEAKILFNLKADNSTIKGCEIEEAIFHLVPTSESESVDYSSNGEDETFGPTHEESSSLEPVLTKEPTQSGPGWPFLLINSTTILEFSKESDATELSIVQRVTNPPDGTEQATMNSLIDLVCKEVESYVENDTRDGDKHNETCLAAPAKMPMELDLVHKLNSSGCKQFSYEELKRATRQFSSENFIGEGGCSNVYKGFLAGGGKTVAVKILKQYKEAWTDFSLEVDIMSSLKHKHITPLIGVCIEQNYLILVYDFLSKGSLEERLHGNGRKPVLPWKVRLNVAIAIAEALDYLHNVSSRPVIHRDVKTSNILLSNEFQPQLSDFGLAIWRPTDSAYTIQNDVVGTFGYIAPEYFMHGRVSDKIDVYSFGMVLLELLTGKKPIISIGLKGQESLVKWAMPLLESGNLKALLDPKADQDIDMVQTHRMVLAATLCLRQTARLRPKASQILELLRGEKDEREWVICYASDLKNTSNEEADDLFPEFGLKPYVYSLSLGSDDDGCASPSSGCTVSLSSIDAALPSNVHERRHFTLKDYLKEEQD